VSLFHWRLDEVANSHGIAAGGAFGAWSEASGGSLAVWAPLLAEESLFAGAAFVDGVLAAGTTRPRRRGLGCGVLGAAPVGGLAARRAAVTLVGPSVQGCGADRAAGSRHVGVTARVLRH
jgi:hypothetical protein